MTVSFFAGAGERGPMLFEALPRDARGASWLELTYSVFSASPYAGKSAFG
jgi:hypothetical protein